MADNFPVRPLHDRVILAQATIGEGLKNVAAGSNPMDLKRDIDKAVYAIVEDLKQQSQTIGGDNDKIRQGAAISANNFIVYPSQGWRLF